MNRYDVVIPKNQTVFRSGCETYTHAIVMHVNPLVLVSEESDMRWTKILLEDVTVVGRASILTRLRIQHRRFK